MKEVEGASSVSSLPRIGIGELLGFSPGDPILLRFQRGIREWALLGLISILIGWEVRTVVREPSARTLEETLHFGSMFIWFVGEPAILAMSAFGAEFAVWRWRRRHRLVDLVMTGMRPITMAQIFVLPPIRFLCVLLAAAWILFAFFLMMNHPPLARFLLLFGLMAFNAGVSVVVGAWMGVALSLKWSRPMPTLVGLASATGVLMVFGGMMATFFFSIADGYLTLSGSPSAYVILSERRWMWMGIVAAVALPFWALKLLLARAYAVHLERVIFPRLEF